MRAHFKLGLHLALALAVPLAALAHSDTPALEPRSVALGTPSAERDLELVVTVDGPAPEFSWWRLWPRVELFNRSSSTSYPIVLPGDGSGAGWREPSVWFSAEALADDGSWVAVPREMYGRCGNHDPYWLDEVVRLAPGESRRLDGFGLLPTFPEAGRVRVYAHYAYMAKPPRRQWGDEDPSPPPGGLGGMEGVAPFELVSAPLELTFPAPEPPRSEIEKDLELELMPSNSDVAYAWEPQALRLRLINRSTTRTHRVVKPSSTNGWIDPEPHLYAMAEVELPGGRWRSVMPHLVRAVGAPASNQRALQMREADWRTRVTDLAPGQHLECEVFVSNALYAFSDATAVRAQVHYNYRAQPEHEPNGELLLGEASLGAMARTPPFRLESNWVVWPISSPLELEVLPQTLSEPNSESPRDELPESQVTRRVRVVLRNRGDTTIEISSTQAPTTLQVFALATPGDPCAFELGCRVVLPQLSILPRSEMSLLDDPRIESYGQFTRLAPSEAFVHRIQDARASLHRPGWSHTFTATLPMEHR